ncbi:MAG: alkaline phosphatase family protein [Anaerolineales bacterium]|nr:alkaline phosphatase family protein [Anaerolineales bacterium]
MQKPDNHIENIKAIKAARFPELNLPAELIHPWYTGFSLLNLPSTVASILGCPELPHQSLENPFLQSSSDITQVIVCLLDGLSFSRFQNWIQNHPLQNRLVEDGFIQALTSVIPSTTCSVLTTLWTGRSPAEHAILGYELFLKEIGIVTNMISHSPIMMPHEQGLLYKAGFDPETATNGRTLGTLFSQYGISTYAFLNKYIKHSGLSRMHYADVQAAGFSSLPEMWINLRTLVEKRPSRRRFIWAYYAGIDTMSHHRSPDSEYTRAEFDLFIRTMEEHFLKPFSGSNNHTLLLLTADHGQISTPKDPVFDLSNHPDLLQLLHLYPTGENRLTFLHIRPGQVNAVKQYFHKTWGDTFVLLDSHQLLDQGFFGPGNPSPASADRIGDLVGIGTGNSYLWWGDRPNPLEGRHGGLSSDEMIVPLAGFLI